MLVAKAPAANNPTHSKLATTAHMRSSPQPSKHTAAAVAAEALGPTCADTDELPELLQRHCSSNTPTSNLQVGHVVVLAVDVVVGVGGIRQRAARSHCNRADLDARILLQCSATSIQGARIKTQYEDPTSLLLLHLSLIHI